MENRANNMTLDFSVIIPVHNEAEILRYTLRSIYNLEPREIIFILDRCTDNTEKIIKSFWKKTNLGNKVKLMLLKVDKKSHWRLHLNFLYDFGIRSAVSAIVLLSQADILHDYVTIKNKINLASHGLVSFAVLEHPHISPWNHFVTKTLRRASKFFDIQRFSGLIALNKKYYLACPLTSNDFLNFDTQIQENFRRKGYRYKYVPSNNFNLRPSLVSHGGYFKLWKVGEDRYLMKKPFLKVLALSLARLTPEVLVGYLHAKYSMVNQKMEMEKNLR